MHVQLTCLKRSLKIDKMKVLKAGDSLMQVESIAECFRDVRKGITPFENLYCLLLSGCLRQV